MDINTILDGSPNLPGALCAQADPEVWFPEKGASNRYAQKVCAICPVQSDCLIWALETDQRHGIWAGTTPRQRQTLQRQNTTTADRR